MKKLYLLITLLLIVIASWFILDLSRYLPPDIIFHVAMKYESEDYQNRLAQELKNQDIPHRLRNDGFIEYRKKDEKKVRQIVEEINSSIHVDSKIEQPPPSIHFSDPEAQNLLRTLLDNEKIPYRIGKLDNEGNHYVIWDRNDDEKVLDLISQVKQKTSCNDSPPSISFPTVKQREYFVDLLKKGGIPHKKIEKTTQQGVEIFVEYDWKDYTKVQKLIKRTIAEIPMDYKT